MQTFSINLAKEIYQVTPREDETYLIETSNNPSFYLYPVLSDSGISWHLVKGDTTPDIVLSVGASIEDYEILTKMTLSHLLI